jgi:DNA repair protein RadD
MQVGGFDIECFQQRIIESVRSGMVRGHRRQVIALRTGAGKSVIAAAMIHLSLLRNRRCLFLASQRELIRQQSLTFSRANIPHAVLMDQDESVLQDAPYGVSRYTDFCGAQVVLASRDTFWSRCVRRQKLAVPKASLVIIDELHRDLGMVTTEICRLYPDAFLVGLTATPGRADGSGIGGDWKIVKGPTHRELVDCGRLVDLAPLCYCPKVPDLSGVKIDPKSKDYVVNTLSKVMSQPKVVGDAVKTWLERGENRPTVAFTCNIQHSKDLCRAFNGRGVVAEHIDNTTPDEERVRIYDDFRNGRCKIICNCAVLTTGWDMPMVSCVILHRPTESVVLYLQMVGRILRSAPGKRDALIIDHGGCIARHGWPTLEWEWADSPLKYAYRHDQFPGETEPKSCPKCACMWRVGPTCPNCGWRPAPRPRSQGKLFEEGELIPVSPVTILREQKKLDEQKKWMATLRYCAMKGRTFKVAKVIFKKKTGKWPEEAGVTPRVSRDQEGMKVGDKHPGFVDPHAARKRNLSNG